MHIDEFFSVAEVTAMETEVTGVREKECLMFLGNK
jgi:hypothetical protein